MDLFNYKRRLSSVVRIGATSLGGNFPVRVQTMGNVSTMDTQAAVAQSVRMIEAGAEYIRFTAQGEREAVNLGEVRRQLNEKGYTVPLVADIHFNPRVADVAACMVEKVRINPGNYVDKVKTFNHIEYTEKEYAAELQKIRDRFIPFLNICKANQTAIRIGVNHGSLSDRIMSRFGDTPRGMVVSCMEFLHICKEQHFENVVISIKASNTVVMVQTVRLLVEEMEAEGMSYPLHLGVTEAGDGEDGRIKSAVGIGALLSDGIGDTIRVSLSEEPENEIPVARKLVDYIHARAGHTRIKALPAAGYIHTEMRRRLSRKAGSIGGGQVPVVISDRSGKNCDFNFSAPPDFIYIGKENPENYPGHLKVLVDAPLWKPSENTYPYFMASAIQGTGSVRAPLKFVELAYSDLTDEVLSILRTDEELILILGTDNRNGVGSQRAALHTLTEAGIDIPVILQREYLDSDMESLQIKSGADFGTLFLDGFGDGIMLKDEHIDPVTLDNYMFGILQAVRLRISKTEYISCPGCGRTLYNLQSTIARIKAATSHLKGLKIGIMGCIVNGPGEMADADYGYVGSGRGCVDLYKGKTKILKNIPEEEAVERLVGLIKEHGDWREL